MNRTGWASVGAAAALAGGVSMAAPLDRATREAWDTLDIIPMPKEIVLSGQTLPLGGPMPAVLVIGPQPLRQSVIGAEWINARLKDLGAPPLAVAAPNAVPPGALALAIGTPADNPLIAAAVADKRLNVGPGNPGERGYEIRHDAAARRVYLGGADALGALYACVTFGELLRKADGGAVWREAAVRDWPDCIHVLSGYTELTNEEPEFQEDFRAYYDRLLRWKITGLNHRQRALRGERFTDSPALDKLRAAVAYGKERGIGALIYAEKPYVGLKKHHPEAAQDTNRVIVAPVTDHEDAWIRGWEFDDLRRETARNLASYIRAVGFTDVAFHDTDTGGWDNPAQWNFRPAVSRARWGDDYAAASAHIHRIYYDEIKRLNPDVRMHVIFYPYSIWIFDEAAAMRILEPTIGGSATAEVLKSYVTRYSAFWKTLQAAFPVEDVTFGIREATPEAVRGWRRLVPGRGAFVWDALMSKWWTPLFSQSASWTPTFCNNRRDVLFVTYAGAHTPMQVLAVREYAWNTNAPGAGVYHMGPGDQHWTHAEPTGEIYSIVLPKLARNVFGPQAAPYLVRALSQNLEPDQALGRVRSSGFDLLKTADRMQWQADNAARAAAALDELWARCTATASPLGMDTFAYRRVVLLRECATLCAAMAKTRACLLLAEQRAGEGRLDEARQAIRDGLALAEQGRADLRRLVAERPSNVTRRAFGRRLTADTVSFDKVEAALRTLEPTLEKVSETHGVVAALLDQLERGRTVKALRLEPGAAPTVLDGRLDDPAWRQAWPIDCFTVLGHGRKLASAYSRVRVLFDGEAFTIGVEGRAPAGLAVQDKDTFDVYVLNQQGMGNDRAGFNLSANGRLVSQYDHKTDLDQPWTVPQAGADWAVATAVHRDADRWSAELRVPVGPMLHPGKTFGTWRFAVSRNCYFSNAPTEISAMLPFQAANKHAVALYPALAVTPEPAPTPVITLHHSVPALETRTLPDRIATVASFSVGVEASAVLTDARLTAEAYGPDGRRQASVTLAEFDTVCYKTTTNRVFEVAFTEVVKQGGIRLRLVSAEGATERWIRFGGWEGAPEAGALFAPGPAGRAGLAAPCFFPTQAALEGGARAPLFESGSGTVELRICRPRSRPRVVGVKWVPFGEALMCVGPYRRGVNPYVAKGLPFALVLYNADRLAVEINERGLAAVQAEARLPAPMDPGAWHHLACAWDAAAPARDQVRLYFDGQRLPAAVTVSGAAKTVRMDANLLRSVQVGALPSGYYPAEMLLADLRISRRARYADAFDAAALRLESDRDTALFLPFAGSLEGRGLTAAGRAYALRATAGVDA